MSRTRALLFVAAGVLIAVFSVLDMLQDDATIWNVLCLVIGAGLAAHSASQLRRST